MWKPNFRQFVPPPMPHAVLIALILVLTVYSSMTTAAYAQKQRRPVITSSSTANGTVGKAFSYQITATNSPTSFGASGLPAGLTVNTVSGLISGTPAAARTSSVTLRATNSSGTGSATLTLTVSELPRLLR